MFEGWLAFLFDEVDDLQGVDLWHQQTTTPRNERKWLTEVKENCNRDTQVEKYKKKYLIGIHDLRLTLYNPYKHSLLLSP